MADQRIAAVFGATGLMGQKIVERLGKDGWEVRIFTRDVSKSRLLFGDSAKIYHWNYDEEGWKKELENTDAVLNFSGAPIFKKWKGDYKKQIVDSRIKATRQISDAICGADNPPKVFINGSASGFYGYDGWNDDEISEASPSGKDFWGLFVSGWEEAATSAEKCGTRVVNIRTSVVLDRESGALPQLVSVFNKGIGGPIRPGDQWFPWIHIDDEIGMIFHALNGENIAGPLNASAPEVPRMRQFSSTLGEVLGKPSRIPIPITILRLMMGEVSLILANGKRVIPRRAEDLGYQFKFPHLEGALTDLLK